MFCGKCGKEVPDGDNFCAGCGKPLSASNERDVADNVDEKASYKTAQHPSSSELKQKINKTPIIIAASAIAVVAIVITAALFINAGQNGDVAMPGSATNDSELNNGAQYNGSASNGAAHGQNQVSFWPERAFDEQSVRAALWEFCMGDIDEREAIISVSPSGNHILAVDVGEIDATRRLMNGVPNMMGWQTRHLSIYSRNVNSFNLAGRIEFNENTTPFLRDTLAVSDIDGVAWSEDEMRVLLTVGSVRTSEFSLMSPRSDIFLLDINAQTIENLTKQSEVTLRYGGMGLLPRWKDNESIMFLGHELLYASSVLLISKNINTGITQRLSNLTGVGPVISVNDYAVIGDKIYFIRFGGPLEKTGFFVANIDGGSEPATVLICALEMRLGEHSHFRGFQTMQTSWDGRWAILTVGDGRMASHDIPFVDHPTMPQPDPRNARSHITGIDWIPSHNVVLYDLESRQIVNPFVSETLKPHMSIATGAAFAPDGKSMIVALLGVGGNWSVHDFFERVTFYQIRLDDGSFDAVRVFEMDTQNRLPDTISWLGNNSILVHNWLFESPQNPVQIVTPEAFEWLLNLEHPRPIPTRAIQSTIPFPTAEFLLADFARVLHAGNLGTLYDYFDNISLGDALLEHWFDLNLMPEVPGVQFVVVTIDSLGGRTAEELAMILLDAWAVGGQYGFGAQWWGAEEWGAEGQPYTDRGMLLLIAPTEGQAAVVVGSGLDVLGDWQHHILNTPFGRDVGSFRDIIAVGNYTEAVLRLTRGWAGSPDAPAPAPPGAPPPAAAPAPQTRPSS